MAQVVSGYQLCGMLRKASGYGGPLPAANDPVEFLGVLCDEGRLRLPFDAACAFWIPQRLPVFSEAQRSLERSLLLSQLGTRSEDTGLVVDSLRQGGDAVYFARLLPTFEWNEVTRWVDRVNPKTAGIHIQSIDEHILILATLKSFVVSYAAE